MQADLLFAMAALWALSLAVALIEPSGKLARVGIVLGCAAGIAASLLSLRGAASAIPFGFRVGDTEVRFQLDSGGFWLLFFGLIPALFAAGLGTVASSRRCARRWIAGLAITLLGAIGVFGLQDSMSFLIAWEVMSVGGAVMILGEEISESSGAPTLFMLALLEVGAVAILFALLMLGNHTGSNAFASFTAVPARSTPETFLVGLLLLFGFGAKLGVLPFYEWFPAAYGSGSGATGVIFSGIVLNAAFYGLSRGVLQWLPHGGVWTMSIAILMIIAGVLSAILSIFNAFQEEDWRRMLSLSSAENASVAVAVLGASLLFTGTGLPGSAALAWIVCLLHLAGHSLAKGTIFLTADGVRLANGSYLIRQTGLLRNTSTIFGIGALFATMSLAALPPQAGFVSEWYVFQTLFQGMQVNVVAARLTIALAAAGLALVVAVALATFAKLFGIGLLGDGHFHSTRLGGSRCASVFVLGLCVLALAVGMPWWVQALGEGAYSLFGVNAAPAMRNGWLLVPLSGKFAFISPTKLVIAGPLLALIPISFFLLSRRAFHLRRVPVWSGGRREDTRRIATTSLAFSNALRTFYGFIYGPTHNLEREYDHGPYFVKRLIFNQEVAPIFGPYLFSPFVRLVRAAADKVSILQSGYLNFYNGLIGILLVLILGLALFY
ncbi:MAG TPA: proton-conducting transporter membrane subunit [Acidobacteriaceae bacterium]|nr:proton-conducting transporter membrane subunit [Acidobacteriaceae bacterium]